MALIQVEEEEEPREESPEFPRFLAFALMIVLGAVGIVSLVWAGILLSDSELLALPWTRLVELFILIVGGLGGATWLAVKTQEWREPQDKDEARHPVTAAALLYLTALAAGMTTLGIRNSDSVVQKILAGVLALVVWREAVRANLRFHREGGPILPPVELREALIVGSIGVALSLWSSGSIAGGGISALIAIGAAGLQAGVLYLDRHARPRYLPPGSVDLTPEQLRELEPK